VRGDPHRGTQSARDLHFAVETGVLDGILAIPPSAGGLVVFAHGSGSSRFSPRNQYVAQRLQAAGLATLLIDLLTAAEDEVDQRTGRLRFDPALLGDRMIAILDRLAADPETAGLPIGVFGASTGAAAALIAAARRIAIVRAVVSRGGRPDLALHVLGQVRSPTLLIVGERDVEVLNLNRQALEQMQTVKELAVVPGATHLFEEPGTLERVADLAADWLTRYLR
jgi:dienelactone hydrolase